MAMDFHTALDDPRNWFAKSLGVESPVVKMARQRAAESAGQSAPMLPPRSPVVAAALRRAGHLPDDRIGIAKRSTSPIVKAAWARRQEVEAERAADPHRTDW